MILFRWLPILSTVLCLVAPAISSSSNLAMAQRPSLLANGQVENYTGFPGYPLPALAPILFSYGWYQGADGQTGFHSGIDLLANPGTPVLAVDVGTVAFAGQQGAYGNLVVINHQGGRQTRYAHLSNITVRKGQQVQTGTTLGTTGSTGQPDITKPHLHFEVRLNAPAGWVAQDPELHLTATPTAQQ
ncbi:M23 family metallopeptidase [Coleofasciculus sp. LEGE 07092]|nr:MULTISPECIES: M23 family metallopeptidase [unclassified Coleofasciculus]MBE9128929.1 M23 family metallopeptidase [Coleofasciculus sp. LEGE 07081]MBE9150397.1 M23 family metallopeptidase [Coleofasciculus sp. LEGE 07092]